MMILYSASIIEAILLHLYLRKNYSSDTLTYAHVHILPSQFQAEPDSTYVLARQMKSPKSERELMLDVLLRFFVKQRLISNGLKSKIEKAKNVRNTFHLSKSRKGIQCGDTSVLSSSEAVVETIRVVRNFLTTNP